MTQQGGRQPHRRVDRDVEFSMPDRGEPRRKSKAGIKKRVHRRERRDGHRETRQEHNGE